MKKKIVFETIDGHKVFRDIKFQTVDTEATLREIAEKTGKTVSEARSLPDLNELLVKHTKYFPLNSNEEDIEDSRADDLTAKNSALNEFEVLTVSEEVLHDYRGKEFWSIDENKRWTKTDVQHIGETPNGVMRENLTPEQLEEIAVQEKEDSLNALSPLEKAKRRISEIDIELESIDRNSGAGRSPREILLELANTAGLNETAVTILAENEARAALLRTERAEQATILAELEA